MSNQDIYQLCKKAFEENKVKELLKGTDGFACVPDKSVPANIPTDWGILFKEGIYKLRNIYSDADLRKILKSEILCLLTEDTIDVWIAFRVFFTQLYFERNNYTDFWIIDDEITESMKNSLAKNASMLKKCNRWQGINRDEGLWSDIVGANRAMIQLFGVNLL